MLQHRLATPVIQPRMYFFDKDGKPLVGGKIYSFMVGTDEFKPTYRNSEFTAANRNPILLDQAGSALIYIRGSVQLKIYDKQGNLIEEKIVYQQQMQTQFFDNYGKALSNGKIWTYDYQSTIKKTSYKYEDIQNPNPVILDQNGWGAVNIVGAYRLRVLDKNNVVVGDQDFKRPPAQVLTSRVYPLYFEEGVTTNFGVELAAVKLLINQSSALESLGTSINIASVVLRDSNNQYTMSEKLGLEFSIPSVRLSNTQNKHSLTESISIPLKVNGANLKNILLRNTVEVEKLKVPIGISIARYK